MLCGHVLTRVRYCNLAQGGGCIDDGSATGFQHDLDLMLDTQEYARQVDSNRPLPLFQCQLMKRQCTLLDARIVVCAIEPSELPDCMIDQCLDVAFGGQVGREECGAQSGSGDGSGRLAAPVRSDVGDDHVCS